MPRCIKPYLEKFPCGGCLPCRINRASAWCLRMFHELDAWDNKALFVTFTYSDENLPADGTLVVAHLQLFWKRLRKRLPKGSRISYYAVGEYGETTNRPHYHAIIYGLSFSDVEYLHVGASSFPYHPLVSESWKLGMIHIGTVTTDSISYVAGYVTKKIVGKDSKEVYDGTNRIPPFSAAESGLRSSVCFSKCRSVDKRSLFNQIWGEITYSPLLPKEIRYYPRRFPRAHRVS